MEDVKPKVEKLTDNVEGYLKTYYRLMLVKATQKVANIASTFLNIWIVIILAFFMFMFLGLGVAWWLGELLNSQTGGFFLTAGIFLVLITTLVLLRKKFLFPFIRNFIIKKIYE